MNEIVVFGICWRYLRKFPLSISIIYFIVQNVTGPANFGSILSQLIKFIMLSKTYRRWVFFFLASGETFCETCEASGYRLLNGERLQSCPKTRVRIKNFCECYLVVV